MAKLEIITDASTQRTRTEGRNYADFEPKGRTTQTFSVRGPASNYLHNPLPTAPQPGTKVHSFWRTSLNVNQASHLLVAQADTSTPSTEKKPLMTFEASFRDHHGHYTVKLKMPLDHHTNEEMDWIVETIETLNSYARIPIKEFVWDLDLGAHYAHYKLKQNSHSIHLAQKSVSARVPLIVMTQTNIVHEMGHGIYHKGFEGDKDWELVFDLSLSKQNYEIIDDSNYLPVPDSYGHPYDAPTEVFASAVHAYFFYADKLSDFILDPNTPQERREFGKLVWCFMRDRVFENRVFTSDQHDPFHQETLQDLIQAGQTKRRGSIMNAVEGQDENVISSAGTRAITILLSETFQLIQENLKSEDPDIRSSLMQVINRFGLSVEKSIQELRIGLKEEDPITRSFSVEVIGEIGAFFLQNNIKTLIKMELRDKDLRTNNKGLVALTEIVPTVIRELIMVLKDEKDDEVLAKARSALVKIGPAAIPALIETLKDEEPGLQAAAVLTNIGPKAIPALIETLKDKESGLLATVVLTNIGPKAIPALIEALKDKESGALATVLLTKIGPKAIPALIEAIKIALKDEDFKIVFLSLATSALIRIRPVPVPDLIAALKDEDYRVRLWAIQTLGWIGPTAWSAVPELERLAKENSFFVDHVADTLKKIQVFITPVK